MKYIPFRISSFSECSQHDLTYEQAKKWIQDMSGREKVFFEVAEILKLKPNQKVCFIFATCIIKKSTYYQLPS